MRFDKAALMVTASALLATSSMGFLCCPTAHAGSPAVAPSAAKPAAAPDGEDSLDDDRAEHWAVPGIAREERAQIAALTLGLAGAGALSLRRRAVLKGKKRHG